MIGGLLLAGCAADDVPVTTGGSGGTGSTTVTTGADEAIPDGADGLAEARRRWAASGIEDYVMTYQEQCFCPRTVVTVTVRAGMIADVSVDEDPVAGRSPEGRTVEDLFDELQQAVDQDAAEIHASYDTATGRPLRFWIDLSEKMADEEHGVDVSAFTTDVDDPDGPAMPTGTSPSVVTTGTTQLPSIRSVATAELTEMWGCGFLFSATNAEHTVAVQLRPTSRPAVGASTVTLPDPAWEGDVPTRGGPAHGPVRRPRLQERAGCRRVLAGRRGHPRDLRSGEPGMWRRPAGDGDRARPRGRGIDGSTLTLADLTLTNDQWGCLAG